MKNIAWGLVLFCVVQAGSGQRMWGATPKTDPDDYNMSVHVSGAQYAPNALFQILTVTIDGKHYEVEGGTSSSKAYMHGNGLLNPGDYHAKLTLDTHKTPFESIQEYEFLLPDGTKRKFTVIAQSE
jgi:hypothetical protein